MILYNEKLCVFSEILHTDEKECQMSWLRKTDVIQAIPLTNVYTIKVILYHTNKGYFKPSTSHQFKISKTHK